MAEEPEEREEDDVDPDELPDVLEQVLTQLGVYVPEHTTKGVRATYSRILNGECMLCGHELQAKTLLVVNALGVVAAFCCGQCFTDMQVKGWLEEEYDDIVQQAKLRGQGVEEHGEPAGDDTDPRDAE